MDIEQLKMILEMVKVVSGDATMIAMVYIGLSYTFKFCVLGALCWVIYKLGMMVFMANTEQREIENIREKINGKNKNYYFSHCERAKLFIKLNEIIDKNES